MLLSLRDAAELLGIKPATIRQQIKNHRFYATKIGRDWLVSKEEIARYAREVQGKGGNSVPEQIVKLDAAISLLTANGYTVRRIVRSYKK